MIRAKGLGPFVVTSALLALIIGLFGFSASLNPIDVLLGRGREVTMPDLTGMPLPRARSEAEQLGLKVTTRSAFSLSVQRGSIIRHDPPAGHRTRVGSKIELTVSKGENSAPMPDAVGKPLEEQRKPLDEAGIKVVVDKVFSETVPDGVVISQSPDPGVVLRGGETAHFVVSEGPEQRPVPSVRGLTPEGAAFLIGQAGLTLGDPAFVDDDSAPPGSVASTSPAEGSSVAKDAPIVLNISAGPKALEMLDVFGQRGDSARRLLGEAGFVIQNATRIVAADDPAIGTVVEQNPAPGDPWRPSQPVTIVVAQGPPASPQTTTTTTPSTTIGPGEGPDTTSPSQGGD